MNTGEIKSSGAGTGSAMPFWPHAMRTVATWSLIERTPAYRAGFALAAFAISFALRYVLDPVLPPGFPFLTFFPAVIITALFAGVAAGTAVAVASGLASWYFFVAPLSSFEVTANSMVAMSFYVFIVATDILLVHAMNLALRAMQTAEQHSAGLADARELMFQELQHRVSNNLTTVSALLGLQARKMSDPVASRALGEAQARLDVVGRLQRRLHDPDRQVLELGSFVEELAQDTIRAMGVEERVSVEAETVPLAVTPDQTVPLGLIATELLMNAVEHGFAGRCTGRLHISLRRTGAPEAETGVLILSDDGNGLPEGFSPETTRSLGLMVAHRFAAQLGGSIRFSRNPQGGTICRLEFPVQNEAQPG